MPRAAAGSADHTDEQIAGGRRVVREIWVTNADGIDFPGAEQVFRIRRQTYNLTGQRLSKEVVHGIASLNPTRATPKQLLGAVRHHWRIEATHWVRDVAYREDHQHAYTGTGAQVMAMIRNVALAVLRLTGHSEITHTPTHRRRQNPDPAHLGDLPPTQTSMINYFAIGLVVAPAEGGTITVEIVDGAVEIFGDPAGLRDLARMCLALSDARAPRGAHIHLDTGINPLDLGSASLMLARDPRSTRT